MEITGQILKENREKLKKSLSEVSLATKINQKTLEAIEYGDKNNLPALTFLRGFIRTYAKHLRLDEEHIMQTFYEEMGTSKPQVAAPNNETNDSEEANSLINPKSMTSRYLTVGAILVLIAMILFVRNVVNKYEKEAQLPPPEDIRQIVKSEITPKKEKKVEETPVEKINPEAIAKPLPKKDEKQPLEVVIKKPSPKVNVEKEQKPKKEALAIKKPEPKIEKQAEVVETAKEIVVVKEKIKTIPQELIVEALDNTQLKFSIDKQNEIRVTLKASEIHVIKAARTIKITLADGGAVSIIHNGKQRGVPGDLGHTLTLNFPK